MSMLPAGVGLLFPPGARRGLLLAVAGSLVVAATEVVGVVAILPLLQAVTDTHTDGGLTGWLTRLLRDPPADRLPLYLAGIVFAAFTAKALLTVAFRWWLVGFVTRQDVETSTRLLSYYLRAPYQLHRSRTTAELIRTMNDATGQVYNFYVNGLISAATEAVTVVLVTVALLVLNPLPTLAIIGYFAVASAFFLRAVRSRTLAAAARSLEMAVAVYHAAFHALGGVKQILLRHQAQPFVDGFRAARLEAASARRVSMLISELPKHFLEVLFIVGIAALTAVSFTGQSAAAGLTTLGLYVAAGFRVLPSVVRLLGALNAVRAGRSALDLVLADLRLAAAAPGRDSSVAPIPLTRGCRLLEVTYRYPDAAEPVLRGISLDIPAGTSIGLVGTSGSGKTTLVDVLVGLHTPTSGQVLVDDEPLDAARLVAWQRSIGLVPQDVYLTDSTLRANIAFGEPDQDVDQARLTAAIEGAQLSDVVAALPHGLATEVGERGARLSGGQRQRIGIARALYIGPTVLVLDEATSALDHETERRVAQTVAALHGRLTVVIVAHRLSTVRACDQVCFLKDGRVAALGTFDQVRAASPEFARLVELGSLG